MKCEHCGYKLRHKQMYCPKCGNTLLSSDDISSISNHSEDLTKEEIQFSLLIEQCREGIQRKKERMCALFLLIALAYAVLFSYFILLKPSRDYEKAVDSINKGNYQQAVELLTDLDYKDSQKIKKDIQFKDPYVGETVLFGTYEQDNILANGEEEIEWTIIDKDKSSVLLISSKCIDWVSFHSNGENSWKQTYLNKWLQKSFLDKAFTEEEKRHIFTSQTEEAVFLLSKDEVERYFSNKESRIAFATPYTKAKAGDEIKNSACRWWLAEDSWFGSHFKLYYVYLVEDDGEFVSDCFDGVENGVRPAIWYDFTKD